MLPATALDPLTWSDGQLAVTRTRRKRTPMPDGKVLADPKDPESLESILNAMGAGSPWTKQEVIDAKWSRASVLELVKRVRDGFFQSENWEEQFFSNMEKKAFRGWTSSPSEELPVVNEPPEEVLADEDDGPAAIVANDISQTQVAAIVAAIAKVLEGRPLTLSVTIAVSEGA